MDEKDKQIERLFDEYGSSLQPNDRLADKARQKMRSAKGKKAKKPAMWIGIAVACAAAFAVSVFSVVSFFNNADRLFGGNTNNSASTPSAPAVQSYKISEVRAQSVDGDFAKAYINTSALADAEIFSEKYYACYIKDTDEFVYLKAVLGISTDSGNIQMDIIAEIPGYINDERAQDFKRLMRRPEYSYYTDYVNGEYMTIAYYAKSDYKYYVTAIGNTDGAQDIAQSIVVKEN